MNLKFKKIKFESKYKFYVLDLESYLTCQFNQTMNLVHKFDLKIYIIDTSFSVMSTYQNMKLSQILDFPFF